MGLGSAYQAGLRIPTPFDEQMGMLNSGGGAYPQNRYRKSGGGGGSTSTPVSSSTSGGNGVWEGGVDGRFVSDNERAMRDKESRARDFKRENRVVEGIRIEKGRQQQERESSRTAGLERDKFESENKRTQGEYDYKQGQLKRIQEYKNAVSAFARGDLPSVSRYLLNDYMDIEGIDKKDAESPLLEFENPALYQKLKNAIPVMERTPDGKISVKFPGQENSVPMSPELFMGKILGRMNPEGEFNTQKAQADIAKTKAEAGRAGLLSPKDIYAIAEKRADTGMGVDSKIYDETLKYFGLPGMEGKKTPGLNEKPIDTTGSLSDGVPESMVTIKNKATGATEKVPKAVVESWNKKPQDSTVKKKSKPKETPKPKKAGITSEVGRTAKAIVGGVVKGFGKYGPKEATSDVADKESVAGLKKAAFKDPGPGVRANVPIRSVAEVTEKKKKKSTSGTAEASEKKESDKDGDGKDKDKKKKKKKKKGGNK